jgi:predicted nuclease of predicted toxin-antitoxin system
VKFLIDAQLPMALAGWLVTRGYEADHVADLGLLTASDQIIWDMAIATGAVVLTKDHDFVEWAMTRRPAPGVIWVRLGNAPNATLIARLDAVWDKVVENLEAGALVVEAAGHDS